MQLKSKVLFLNSLNAYSFELISSTLRVKNASGVGILLCVLPLNQRAPRDPAGLVG